MHFYGSSLIRWLCGAGFERLEGWLREEMLAISSTNNTRGGGNNKRKEIILFKRNSRLQISLDTQGWDLIFLFPLHMEDIRKLKTLSVNMNLDVINNQLRPPTPTASCTLIFPSTQVKTIRVKNDKTDVS